MSDKNINENEIIKKEDNRDIESAAERLAEIFIAQIEFNKDKPEYDKNS